MPNYDAGSYPYFEAEDIAFCRCFRLTEDDFLKLAGGLKVYTEHRLNRQQARGATITNSLDEKTIFDVPRLPDNTEQAMARIQLPGVKESEFAAYLLKDQMNTVTGIIQALHADKGFKAQAARDAEEKVNQRKYALERLAVEAAHLNGWSPDSQSAKDWAERKYVERYASKRGY
jgi:plasmid replication initiation protein